MKTRLLPLRRLPLPPVNHLLPLMVALLLTTACHSRRLPENAAKNGDPAAQYTLGQSLLSEAASLQRASQAFPWLLAAARQGHREAQTAVAFCLENGLGIPINEAQALHWYKQAARSGSRYAAVSQARLELPRRPQQALRTLQSAANTGYPPAQLLLARLYITGKYLPQNPAAAVDNLRFAAMQGSGEASILMAACYLEGYGVPQNAALALGWLKNAADEGYPPAQKLLKLCN